MAQGNAAPCAGTLGVSNMDAQREYSAEEVTRLRDDLNDLVSIMVSRSMVERNHRRLGAQPNDGGPGATFAFSIPCASADTPNAVAALRIS